MNNKNKLKPLYVTPHALVRYLERGGFEDVAELARLQGATTDTEIVNLIAADQPGQTALKKIWNAMGGKAAVYFDALGPGQYPFEHGFIRISNNHEQWNEPAVVTFLSQRRPNN